MTKSLVLMIDFVTFAERSQSGLGQVLHHNTCVSKASIHTPSYHVLDLSSCGGRV